MMKPLKPSPLKSAAANQAQLHVGPGMRLEGRIEACETLVVEGAVDASVECDLLSILRSGTMQGNVTVESAEIDGRFDGTLVVRSNLKILATGRVSGTISCGALEVDLGGSLEGTVRMLEISQTERDATARPGGMASVSAGSLSDNRGPGNREPDNRSDAFGSGGGTGNRF